MKKLILGIVVLAATTLWGCSVSALDTNNFIINELRVDLSLSRDNENRSVLETTETIKATFPDYDQNRGLERGLVDRYGGHSTSLRLESVKDEAGNDYEYSFENSVLRIGNKDIFVHGEKTYVIKYSQRDVTRYFENVGRDEFYWDVVGADSLVVREKVAVYLNIDSALQNELSGHVVCYQGDVDSKRRCKVESGEGEFQITDTRLGLSEGITLAVGFNAGTFAPYEPTLLERIMQVWAVFQGVLALVGSAVMVWVLVRWSRITERKKERSTVVPEYLPPANYSVTASARVASLRRSVVTAQMLDLAVRHYVKIYEVSPKKTFKPAEYEIEIVKSVEQLKWEELELLKDMFGEIPVVGQKMNLKKLQNNERYFNSIQNNDTDLDNLIRGEYGLLYENTKLKSAAQKTAKALLIVGLLTLSPVLLIAAAIAWGLSFVSWTLTDEGLSLVQYLNGLKMYIGVAETERIKLLQSPEGASKVASVADGTDGAQLIKLYERVLPYAVLFGQEKQWNKQLGSYYEVAETQPDWYSGHAAFSAIAFSSAMSDFSSASSYVSSDSSSLGGSDGGGSVGSGGGGGSTGGW